MLDASKALIAVLGGIAIGLLGGWDKLLQIMLILTAFDYLTGFLAAAKAGKLNSNVGLTGMLKKIGYFCVVAVAVCIDDLTGQPVLRSMIIIGFCINEALSCLENAGALGVRIPSFLTKYIERLDPKAEELPPNTQQYQNQPRQQDK